MGNIYISNAFSLNMLPAWFSDITEEVNSINVEITAIAEDKIKDVLSSLKEQYENKDFISVVGHEDTANIFSSILGIKVPYNRTNILLNEEDTLIVGQYIGPRLEEGTKVLPEGSNIKWLEITINS